LYRHSITVAFLSKKPKKETPDPFAEIRVTIFSKLPKNRLLIRKTLLEAVCRLAWTFISIRMAVAQHTVTWYVPTDKEYEVYLPKSSKMVVLTGFEYNVKVPDEEAIEYIAMSVFPYFNFVSNPELYIRMVAENIDKYLNYPIYYAVFYDANGLPKREFNNWEIRHYVSPQSASFTRASWLRGEEDLYDYNYWRSIFMGLMAEVE